MATSLSLLPPSEDQGLRCPSLRARPYQGRLDQRGRRPCCGRCKCFRPGRERSHNNHFPVPAPAPWFASVRPSCRLAPNLKGTRGFPRPSTSEAATIPESEDRSRSSCRCGPCPFLSAASILGQRRTYL